MRYLSAKEIAKKWNLTDRSVRKYCQDGKIPGAFLTGKTWNIPEDCEKPERAKRKSSKTQTLLDILKEQKDSKLSGGIYHRIQIDLTYNSITLREADSPTTRQDIFLKPTLSA